MKNIVLIGMPASGKSTVGVILAKTLGIGFVDTDLVIQKKCNKGSCYFLRNIIPLLKYRNGKYRSGTFHDAFSSSLSAFKASDTFSILSAKTAYPRIGSLTNTCVTAPTSIPS